MDNPRLLITGASGFLGYAACRQARSSYDVVAAGNTRPVRVSGVRPVACDLTRPRRLADLLVDIRPDAILHLAAAARPNDCEAHPRQSAQINISAVATIARWCGRQRVPLVVASSDLVFDGRRPPYDESSPTGPVCVYGRQKRAAEVLAHRYAPHAAICRLPLMFGHAPSDASGFFGQLVDTLRNGRPVRLFTDEYRTPVDTDSAAGGLLVALNHPGRLLHLGGRVRLSRYTMGLMVADCLGVSSKKVTPVTLSGMPMPAPRAPDVSLDSRRAYALGYDPAPIETAIHGAVGRYLSQR